MNLSGIFSSTTLDAVSTDVQAAMMVNAQQYAQDEFLAGRIGQAYLGLHRLPESAKEAMYRWTFPANVGNTDPTKKVAHGPHTWAAGDPALFTCQGAPGIEDNHLTPSILETGLGGPRVAL